MEQRLEAIRQLHKGAIVHQPNHLDLVHSSFLHIPTNTLICKPATHLPSLFKLHALALGMPQCYI